MKKNYIVGVMWLLFSIITQAQILNNNLDVIDSDIINEKGKNYIREGLLSEVLDREKGISGSEQHIESFYGEGNTDGGNNFSGFNSSTKGIVIGTTSLLKKSDKTPQRKYITGVSLGYLESKIKYKNPDQSDKMKTMGGNIYFAVLNDRNVAFTHLGYSHSTAKDGVGRQDRNNLSVGTELGRVYPLNKNTFIYPYISLEYCGSFREKDSKKNYWYEKESINIGRGNIGFYYVYDKNKVRLSLNTKYTGEISNGMDKNIYSWNSIENLGTQKKDNEYITSSLSLGYYLSKDMLLSLEVTGRYSKRSENTIYGLKIAHIF
jgi:hypothetical protein